MKLALVGVDTNVFLDSLECLRCLIRHMNRMDIAIFVPSITVRELDKLKEKSTAARTALAFIETESNRQNPRLYVEESIKIKGKENDDTFALACQMNSVSVILSNDTALRIKAGSVGTPALGTIGKVSDFLFEEIKKNIENSESFMVYELKDDQESEIYDMRAAIAKEIYAKKLEPILKEEVGEDLIPYYTPKELSSSIEAIVKYTVRNYGLFEGELPRFGKKILQQMLKQKITKQDIEEILCIFGVEQPKWFKEHTFE